MGDYNDAFMRNQNAAVQARTKAQNRANVLQLKLIGQSHPTGLTANLLKLFEPRLPLEYKPPPEKRKCPPLTGMAQFASHFAEPGDPHFAPPVEKAETPAERRARIHKLRLEKGAETAAEELKKYDPHNDPNVSGDPYKTLFVARLSYETTESKIKREFESYGPIKRVRLVTDKETNKPRGYAFIEYMHTRDMKAAYKQADGRKLDGRRVLVDVERGRTVPNWRPRRLGGGLGTTRVGGEEVNQKYSGREQEHSRGPSRSAEPRIREDRHGDRSLAAAVAVWMVFLGLIMMEKLSNAERLLKDKDPQVFADEKETRPGFLGRVAHFLWQSGESSYEPVWPEMQFGWKIVVGSIVGFFGAALGSVGGVGGGGIFVPMLTLIIGFDPKSATAISKCMIMGAAGSTVYYNLRLRHPTLDMPLIDYDLALLFQPMLMLGISIGVAFNVMFADWMVTVLLIILFIGTSTKALFKGIETWKKETVMKKEAAEVLESESKAADADGQDYKQLPSGPSAVHEEEVPIIKNIYWKESSLLLYVWLGFLGVQLAKEYVAPCSITYWILTSLQVPIAVSVTLFEAICLYKGTRVIASKGKEITNWKIHQIIFYCFCGIVAGMVGGLLGLGGGFILGPLFLELGIPPQVASATSTFAMSFSSSMSVVQYYLLDRFPVPYAAYFAVVATFAALAGQHVVRKIIAVLGRASIIIFILALTIFVSAISLGGVGIENMVKKMKNQEYMGFENLCHIS